MMTSGTVRGGMVLVFVISMILPRTGGRKPANETIITCNMTAWCEREWIVEQIQAYLASQGLLYASKMCLMPSKEL